MFMFNVSKPHQHVFLGFLAVLASEVHCTSYDAKLESNKNGPATDRDRALTVDKPTQPAPPTGQVTGSPPSTDPAERGAEGVVAHPTGPVMPAEVADKASQTFNLARSEQNDPSQWLPKMASRATSVVVGKIMDEVTLPSVPAMPTRHISTVQVLEVWAGASIASVEVTWTETSESHELKVGQTYLLFLLTGSGQTCCIDDQNAALPVVSGVVDFRGNSLLLKQAQQLTTTTK